MVLSRFCRPSAVVIYVRAGGVLACREYGGVAGRSWSVRVGRAGFTGRRIPFPPTTSFRFGSFVGQKWREQPLFFQSLQFRLVHNHIYQRGLPSRRVPTRVYVLLQSLLEVGVDMACDGARAVLPDTSDRRMECCSSEIKMCTQKSPVCGADWQVQDPPPSLRSRTVRAWMDLDWVRDGG